MWKTQPGFNVEDSAKCPRVGHGSELRKRQAVLVHPVKQNEINKALDLNISGCIGPRSWCRSRYDTTE